MQKKLAKRSFLKLITFTLLEKTYNKLLVFAYCFFLFVLHGPHVCTVHALAYGRVESHMTNHRNSSQVFGAQAFSLQALVEFRPVFKKIHTSEMGFLFLLFVVLINICLATSDKTPECEKNQ